MFGYHGFEDSVIWNNLKACDYENLIGRSHKRLDLAKETEVETSLATKHLNAMPLIAIFVIVL